MKKNTLWKGLLRTLLLLLLAAGAIAVAWFAENSPDITPEPPQNSDGSSVTIPVSTVTQSLTEISVSTAVTDPEYSDVTATETQSSTGIGTDTASEVKRIAFTFDDGPHWEYTQAIADEFAKYGGNCTYFIIGNRVHGKQAEAMKHAASLGNEIGIHGYTHTIYFNDCTEDEYLNELQKTSEAIQNNTGIAPVLMRPPGGYMTNNRISACTYSVILWNVDTKDWKYKKQSQENIDIIVQNVLTTVSDGDIILMHDIYENTVEAVKILLPLLKEQGYEFVTVSELLGESREAGKKYRYAY